MLSAVDVNGFWEIVERARGAAGPAADRAKDDGQPSEVAEALVTELARLTLPEIVAFDRVLSDVIDGIDTWDVAAACWIIEHGFLSDDGFSDFRAGLVGLGRGAFEAVATDPDTLAGNPAVAEIAASADDKLWIGDEELLFAAQKAYERRTGDSDAFWEAVEVGPAPQADGPEPEEERWDLHDATEWRTRLPGLAGLFLAVRRVPD
ncbi:DUF4240 domain-containing protein [Micromonospora vulcania]|uniref:DUF4240 domain-containing protein n=1 Tax=Micromonospora vulcania TaxID=1441873 RepID=A0ABW1HB12_9ACTN